jgi:hypothetical protein
MAPNPTTDYLNVTFNGFESSLQFQVYDLKGRVLVQKEYFNVNGNKGVTLALNEIPDGIYILKSTSSKGIDISKFEIRK